MNRQLKIFCTKNFFGGSIDIHAAIITDSTISEATPLVFSKVLENGDITTPFLSLSVIEAQILIDALWDCGLRPSAGSGSAGAMEATQKHLEDMRTLVFKQDFNHVTKGGVL